MKFSEKSRSVFSKIEIAVAAIMFFVMLISCGLYINIKLNGKISNLPPLSENDTQMLLRSSSSDDVSYTEDLLEPVFIGVKNEGNLSAVLPSDTYRRSFEEMIYDNVSLIFGGTRKKIDFESQSELYSYIQQKKDSDRYILVSFYTDIPSQMVLPSVLNNPIPYNEKDDFLFKHLFFLPDSNNNLYACAVSENYDVTELYIGQQINFDKILNESYDVSEGFVRFGYASDSLLKPVYMSSLRSQNYRIDSYSLLYGKDHDKEWVNNLFDIFSFNSSLVKSFTSGDKSEINHVDESKELVINDDGTVIFKALDSNAVMLDDYLGYISEIDAELSFSDKIFVLKKLVNRLVDSSLGISYSLTGINYNDDVIKLYFKYMTDGIFLYDTPYDAVFELDGNKLVYAEFKVVKCTSVGLSDELLVPQKYADIAVSGDESDKGTYLVLKENGINGFKSAKWSYVPSDLEVKK